MNAHAEIPNRAVARVPMAQLALHAFASADSGRIGDHGARRSWDGAAGSASAVLSERIERAHCAFVSRAHTRIERAAELMSVLDADDPAASCCALAELQTLAHSLSGTAGSFGYARLSELAELLEAAVSAGQAQHQRILGLVMEMGAEFLDRATGRRPAPA